MKFLLKLLFLLLSIVVIILVVGFFIDGKFSISRSVNINQTQTEVFEYVSLLSNQKQYGVWHKKDPNISSISSGTDGTVGFISSWDSSMEEVGKGEQEITEIINNKLVKTELRFKCPMKITCNAFLEVKESENNTSKVVWKIEGESPYPFNILALFMDMESELGLDLDEGLKTMKAILESQNK